MRWLTLVGAPDLVSVVTTAYNEAANLLQLYDRVKNALAETASEFELIIVDNGSTDASLAILRDLNRQDRRVQFVSLTRNFGHQGGLIAGLNYARGDVIIMMDADLQHPPEMLPEMMNLWRQGFDVVNMHKNYCAANKPVRRIIDRLYYKLISKLAGMDLSSTQSDFRLMDRRVLTTLLSLPERKSFLRGLTQWLGFRQARLEYAVAPRLAGKSRFKLRELMLFAMEGILAFSALPLRLFSLAGILISSLSLGYFCYLVAMALIHEARSLTDWATLTSAVFFLGGIQLMGIGLLGEYLTRVCREVSRRPEFIVSEHSYPTSEQPKEEGKGRGRRIGGKPGD